jgi:hypothetical protein
VSAWRDRAILHRGDYRETLALRPGLVDLVLTSPPYCDARTYGAAVSWTMTDYAALGDAIFGALRPGGWALVNVDAPVREWRPGFGTERGTHPWRLMLDWMDRVGFRCPDRLVFERLGLPGEYRGRFRNDFEPLLWFQKPGGEGYFDKRVLAADAVGGAYAGHNKRRPVDRWPRKRDGTQDPGSQRMGGWAAENGKRQRGTVWSYDAGSAKTSAADIEAQGHPARWPYRLAHDLVACFCPPDGLACDPFVGAGTSLAAAMDLGRRFVGGDLLTRERDGVPWGDVAASVMDRRTQPPAQTPLFGRGAA